MLPKNLDSSGSARIPSPGIRALDVDVRTVFQLLQLRANLLIHGQASVGRLGRWLAFKQSLAAYSVSAIGTNNDIGCKHFPGLKSDGFSGYVDGDDLGVCPVSCSSLVTELVEEFSDICELNRKEPQKISGNRRRCE